MFDRISFEGIYSALEFFDIGNSYINMVKTAYTDFVAMVQNSEYFSDTTDIKHGVGQGEPNSSNLFLICAEVLDIAISKNKDIVGIPINDIMHLLAQYADGMDSYLTLYKKSFYALFKT